MSSPNLTPENPRDIREITQPNKIQKTLGDFKRVESEDKELPYEVKVSTNVGSIWLGLYPYNLKNKVPLGGASQVLTWDIMNGFDTKGYPINCQECIEVKVFFLNDLVNACKCTTAETLMEKAEKFIIEKVFFDPKMQKVTDSYGKPKWSTKISKSYSNDDEAIENTFLTFKRKDKLKFSKICGVKGSSVKVSEVSFLEAEELAKSKELVKTTINYEIKGSLAWVGQQDGRITYQVAANLLHIKFFVRK
jgi:hypothetical protein